MYAWEGAFQRRLKDIRDIEVGYIWKTVYFISGMAITTVGAPVLVRSIQLYPSWHHCFLTD